AGDNRPHRDNLAFAREANQLAMDEAEVAARIAALGQDRLVITGGEPLLQGAALARMAALLPQGTAIEIETNGTVAPHAALDPLVAQYNVSPKLAHSGNAAELALIPERLAAFAADPRAWFKFVISSPEDLAQVLEIRDNHCVESARIFLMPEGTGSAVLRERMGWLAPLALRHGLRLTDRLHIHLYGDTRGT
ncbi:MAG TPA: 7-carboxy-7-deazaguanine synthase QueE, partial [Novosphingobium sp.]|nr:7-carboxy-7-deazaguanine synthase QueE [Novosphingobium sp.]